MHALVLHWSMVQQLFFKLNKLSHVAADVLAGRDRMIVMLLMKFVETFVVFISNDQFFWEEMENGAKSLGQMGLQQVCAGKIFHLIWSLGCLY